MQATDGLVAFLPLFFIQVIFIVMAWPLAVRIKMNRDNLALFGLTAADVDEMIDLAFLGLPVSQIYEGQNRHDLVVRYAPEFRDEP